MKLALIIIAYTIIILLLGWIYSAPPQPSLRQILINTIVYFSSIITTLDSIASNNAIESNKNAIKL